MNTCMMMMIKRVVGNEYLNDDTEYRCGDEYMNDDAECSGGVEYLK